MNQNSKSLLPSPASSCSTSPTLNGSKIEDSTSSVTLPAFDFKINQPPVGRPVRVYCDGIYDSFHFGHAKALEQAKKAFPHVYLLVGVCNDEETHKRKGRTIMKDTERYESVRHCKWVDEVIEAAPWVVTQEFMEQYKIDYVAHDAEPYQSTESGDVYTLVKSQGKFLPTKRTDGISTSDLITRIVRDYDLFLTRNLQRGVSAKELNISYFKEQQIKTQCHLERLKVTVMDQLNIWELKSHILIQSFAGLFGIESFVGNFLAKTKLITSPTGSRIEQ